MNKLNDLLTLDDTIPAFELYYLAICYGNNGLNVEFGTGRGVSTVALALGLKQLGKYKLDSYDIRECKRARKLVKCYGVENVNFFRADALKQCRKFEPFSLGLCFIDLSCNSEYLRKILEELKFKMKRCGVICVHDSKHGKVSKVIQDFLDDNNFWYMTELNVGTGLALLKHKQCFGDIGVSQDEYAEKV